MMRWIPHYDNVKKICFVLSNVLIFNPKSIDWDQIFSAPH